MALLKDGKLQGSVSSYGLSKKLGYHEVKDFDQLYSFHLQKNGEWMCQQYKWWAYQGRMNVANRGTYYDVSSADFLKPIVSQEITLTERDVKKADVKDDDIPF
jgi:hypothetical protein